MSVMWFASGMALMVLSLVIWVVGAFRAYHRRGTPSAWRDRRTVALWVAALGSIVVLLSLMPSWLSVPGGALLAGYATGRLHGMARALLDAKERLEMMGVTYDVKPQTSAPD